MAGNVKRYHTWPTIQTQNNADHTWNVMRIYWVIFGNLPDVVSTHLIWHDVGELVSGDVPHPIKRDNPELGLVHRRLEDEAVLSIAGPRAMVSLPSDYVRMCKLCDLIEMYEFATVEKNLGNKYAEPVMFVTMQGISVLNHQLSRVSQMKVQEYLTSEVMRDN